MSVDRWGHDHSPLTMCTRGCPAYEPMPTAPVDIQPKANARQEGGDHYKKLKIEVWDYIVANGIGYLPGNVIKYMTRYKSKNGVEDLKKARHYLDKLIEVELQVEGGK